MKLIKFAILCLAFGLVFPANAEDEALAKLFARHGVDGTIVMASQRTGQTFIHNDLRAKQRFAPASTFKIPNTLIAVEEGVAAGPDEVFHWDGQVYDFADWNHDQTLASAFKVSCVWCYQALARRVGAENYIAYLRKMDYGQLRQPFEAATFWLDGSLQISAVEQIQFLQKLHRRDLPVSAKAYETLRQIMLAEQTPSFSLWAKTGWAARTNPQVGWYVGYVETKRDTWLFALNMAVNDAKDLPLRPQLVREALQAKGVIE